MADVLLSVDDGTIIGEDYAYVQLCTNYVPIYHGEEEEEVVVKCGLVVGAYGVTELPVENTIHTISSPNLDLVVVGVFPLNVNDSTLTLKSDSRTLLRIWNLEVEDCSAGTFDSTSPDLYQFCHIHVSAVHTTVEELDLPKVDVTNIHTEVEGIAPPAVQVPSIVTSVEELHVPRISVSELLVAVEEIYRSGVAVSSLVIQYECVPGAILNVANSNLQVASDNVMEEVLLEVEISSLSIMSDKIKLGYTGSGKLRGYIWLF